MTKVEDEDAAVRVWEELDKFPKDEYGLPEIDEAQYPTEYKEVAIVRTLVKQERSHGQWKK